MDITYIQKLGTIDQKGHTRGRTLALAELCKKKGYTLLVDHFATTRIVDCDTLYVGESLRNHLKPIIIDPHAFCLIFNQIQQRHQKELSVICSANKSLVEKVNNARFWQRLKFLFTAELF